MEETLQKDLCLPAVASPFLSLGSAHVLLVGLADDARETKPDCDAAERHHDINSTIIIYYTHSLQSRDAVCVYISLLWPSLESIQTERTFIYMT